MELSVDNAVESVEVAITPQAAEPGFEPHLISPKELAQLLKDSKRIVFLTGSGIC
jgi:thiamine pyrophosphate-dependent acetolactate synthase large subunit-like protein